MKQLNQEQLMAVNGGMWGFAAFTSGAIIGAALASKLEATPIMYAGEALFTIPQVALVAAGAIALGSVCYGLTENVHGSHRR